MKVARFHAPGDVRLEDVAEPVTGRRRASRSASATARPAAPT